MLPLTHAFRNITLFNSSRLLLAQRQNVPAAAALATRSIEEKVGLPSRPKRPLTPYFRFMQQIRPEIVQKYPKASLTEVVTHISDAWKSVDQATKDRLGAEYKKDQQSFVKERAAYENKLTEEQRQEIKQLRQIVAEAKEKRKLRSKIRAMDKPKKPATPFLRYLAEEKTKVKAPVGLKDYQAWVKQTAEAWWTVDKARKEAFQRQYQKDQERYKDDLKTWEERMIREGHSDVVRIESRLVDPFKPKTKRSRKSSE